MRTTLYLAAMICVAGTAAACPPAKTVRFAAGTESAVLTGAVPPTMRDCFSLGLKEGQRLTITQGPRSDDTIVFQIYQPPWKLAGPEDGITVTGRTLPGAGEGEDTRRFDGRLPVSGTYLIVVGATRGGGGYQITVTAR